MVKLSDIAKEADVSVTTVSMVLSGKGRISPEIRTKVQKVSDSLGYTRKRKTTGDSTWVILVPMEPRWDPIWHFIRPVIDNITSSAWTSGYSTCIVPVYEFQTPEDVKSSIYRQRVSGIFSIHFGNTELFDNLEREGLPVIIINNSQFQKNYHSICVDDFQGAYEGTRHLLDAGHREIAFIDYPRKMLPSLATDRFFGFLKALEEENIKLVNDWKITVDLENISDIKDCMHTLLYNKPAPTAFFVHDDFMANRLIHILAGMDKKVPEDISIIAPGDTLNYDYPEIPGITTMSINPNLLGKYAAEMMLERINSGQQNHVLKIKQQLILRGSTLPKK